jgi:preprotein translocase subunit YajC
LVGIVVLFWFLMIRPARKRQQTMVATQNSVAPGDEVMLGSGIYGTVASIDDETLQLELAPGTEIKVARQAVVRVVEDRGDTAPAPTQEAGSEPSSQAESTNVIDEL